MMLFKRVGSNPARGDVCLWLVLLYSYLLLPSLKCAAYFWSVD
ncbi:Uncharacterised protein [Vibrio cholerae]|nr:Uncharacterised protein [Vibrio cholerae]